MYLHLCLVSGVAMDIHADGLEWDESELYEDPGSPSQPHNETVHVEEADDDDEVESAASSEVEFMASPGRPVPTYGRNSGQQSESAHSSTLLVTIDDCTPDLGAAEADTVGSLKSMARAIPDMSASVPTRMGTSAPINIPFMGKWKREGTEKQEVAPRYPSTFVPPHQLSQKDDFLSLTALSPAAAIKRDRLRARNAILRKTGFLEGNVHAVDSVGLLEKSRVTGGLSQAFGGFGGNP